MIALLNNADVIMESIDHTINIVNKKDNIVSIIIVASLFSERRTFRLCDSTCKKKMPFHSIKSNYN